MIHVNALKPPSKPHWKDPYLALRHFNWLWTNYIILSQVAEADGLIRWPVSIWSQGGLLLGMDTPLLGSLPAWVPPCLLLLLGANRANKFAGFQAGVKACCWPRWHWNTVTVIRDGGRGHEHAHWHRHIDLKAHHTRDSLWVNMDDGNPWFKGWHV